jgi:uncharacterized protein (TIGR02266 family)
MVGVTRNHKRYPSVRPIEVRCASWGQFVKLYTNNISRGGFFIQTDSPPPNQTDLEIRINLPRGHLLSLQAKVVHFLSPEQAEVEGKKPGMGVKFETLSGEQERHIQALIELSQLEVQYPEPAVAITVTPSPAAAVSLPPVAPVLSSPAAAVSLPPVVLTAELPSPEKPARKKSKTAMELELFGDLGQPTDQHQSIASEFSLQKAQEHLAHRRYQKAEIEYQQVLATSPDSLEARVGLLFVQAQQLKEKGETVKAVQKFEAILELDEQHPEAAQEVRLFHEEQRKTRGVFGRLFQKK